MAWRRDGLVGLLLLLTLGGSAPYFGRLMNANERPRVLQAIAWVDDGELAVDGPAARGIDPGVDVARSPVDGRLYPNKPPGATVPAVIAYRALRTIAAAGGPEPTLRAVTIGARLLGALLPTVVLLLVLLRRLRARGAGAAAEATVIALAVATPLTVYARLLFGHTLAACLLLVGTLWLLDGTQRETSSWRRALAGGLLASSAIAVEYLAVFAGLPLAGLVLLRWRGGTSPRVLGAAVLGALLPVALLLLYHARVFGSPWATGYHHVTDAGFAQVHGRGLLGLGVPTGTSIFEHLLSPWGGLIVWAPLVVVALGVALARWRSLDDEARVGTAILLVVTLVTLGLQQTGGWRVGPRYMVLAIPLCAYGLVAAFRGIAARPVLAGVLLGVSLASAVLDGLAANLFPHLVPHGNPYADLLLPLAAEGRMTYCVLPGGGLALAVMLALPIALLGWSVWVLVQSSERPRGPAVLGLGLVVAGGLLLAALAPDEHPEALGDLDAVRSIWEPDGPRPPRERVLSPLP